MVRAGLAVFTILAVAPAAAVEGMPPDWSQVGNSAFRAAITKLVGSDMVDCGLFSLDGLENPKRSERRRALNCIADARKRGVPFKYGTRRIPIDSFADEVYVGSAAGETWMLIFDVMVVDYTYQMWIQRCESVSIDRKTLIMHGEKCEEREP